MPELSEVETARRRVEHHLLDRTITGVACDDPPPREPAREPVPR